MWNLQAADQIWMSGLARGRLPARSAFLGGQVSGFRASTGSSLYFLRRTQVFLCSWAIAQRRARCRATSFRSPPIWTRPLAGRSRQSRSKKKSVAARRSDTTNASAYLTDSEKNRRRAAISRVPFSVGRSLLRTSVSLKNQTARRASLLSLPGV